MLLKEVLHRKYHFGRRIFCNGLVSLTPEKKDSPVNEETAQKSDLPPNTEEIEIVTTASVQDPEHVLKIGTNDSIEKFVMDNKAFLQDNADIDLVRRHSLSARSPHKGSIADEILTPIEKRRSLDRTKLLIDEVKNISARLSEYESCVSTDEEVREENTDTNEESSGYKTVKRGGRRNKRKNSTTPTKGALVKKVNVE